MKSGVLSIQDIANILEIGKNQTYALVQKAYLESAKFFPVFKIGNAYKIPKQPFYKWLNNSSIYYDF